VVEWERLKKRCPGAKLVCIDIQPNTTTQARSGTDVLNVGGFSDAVFGVVSTFLESPSHPEHWIREIEKESI
jgi:60 kDa SS-A/Ro ribonucleoprotein